MLLLHSQMAMVNVSAAFRLNISSPLLPSSSLIPRVTIPQIPPEFLPCALNFPRKRTAILIPSFALKNRLCEAVDTAEEKEEDTEESSETLLYSFAPLPLLFLAALPGAGTLRSLFGPFVELVKAWSLPDWLVHWGHPGNMNFLPCRLLYSLRWVVMELILVSESASLRMWRRRPWPKTYIPKLLGGMFFFFALGATGGITALLTSDKPIFESPHAITGFTGLTLLTIQTILPALFEGNPGLRNVHGILGSGIITLFLVHAAFGLQLGLSF
ncbi:hypothetical protein F0562_016920 [Nyssa sinensis]|uniref:Uncharacterized protein n=1 Tax=Nyssa sinensis TaxID=561372 RepID=A0A5J4ZFF9_9ASTE|nr:hypothetical protein F0562_016920 [Nyssa sinensis]